MSRCYPFHRSSRAPVSVKMSLKRISPAPIYAPAIRTHKFDQCRANQCRLAVARNARHYLRVPGLDLWLGQCAVKNGPQRIGIYSTLSRNI